MDEQQKQRVTRQIAAALADCAEELSVAAIRELAAINDALRAAGYPAGEAGVRALVETERKSLAEIQQWVSIRDALLGDLASKRAADGSVVG